MENYHLSSNTILENNLIFIRSKDGIFINENNRSSFSIVLKRTLRKAEDELFKIIVQSVQIPYTFFNTNSNNNIIDYKENGILKTPLVIPDGNYNILELASTIQNLLNSNTSFTSENYTLTYNQIKNKITIKSLSLSNTEFLFKTGVNLSKSINRQIGYTNDTDITINNSLSSSSDSFVDLISIHSLFIRSNLSSNTTIDSQSLTNTDILVSIPITSNPLSIINFQYYEGMSFNYQKGGNITEIVIELTDQNGNIIDLGKKIDWELLLNIQLIKNPLFNRISQISQSELDETIENVKLKSFKNDMDAEIDIEEIKQKGKVILEQNHSKKINLIKNEIDNL